MNARFWEGACSDPRRGCASLVSVGWRVSATALAMVVFISSAAFSRDWYFSNCAAGGAGTIGDPWCLDPGRNGGNDSFAYLADGVEPEVAAGDTIYLCAGACNGSGTGTFFVHATQLSNTIFIVPKVDGTPSSPITIQVYPGETVIINGDTDNDNQVDAGEVHNFFRIDDGASPTRHYKFIGDPQATGTPHLSFIKTTASAFILKDNPGGWVWDGIEIGYLPGCAWVGGVDTCDYYAAGGSGAAWAIRADDTFSPHGITIKNSHIHHVWDTILRQQSGSGGALIENNVIHHTNYINNDFVNNGTPHIWRGNTFYDFGRGMHVEDRLSNVTIEDNVFYCLEGPNANLVGSNDYCTRAIIIYDGDNGSEFEGQTRNITIRRNVFYSASGAGKFSTGIWWDADWNGGGDAGYLIENNLFWGLKGTGIGRNGGGTASCPNGTPAAIFAQSNQPITIRNNTIYDAKFPITLDNECGGPPTNHIVTNNIILQASGGEEIYAFAGAEGSVIEYNEIHYGNQSGDIANLNGTLVSCANVATLGTGNKCTAGVMFRACSDSTFCQSVQPDYSLWDLHLVSTDTIAKDAGTTGAVDDIDGETRADRSDFGADEVVGSGGGGAPTAQISVAPTPPTSATGLPLLREGTWMVTLATSVEVVSTPSVLEFTDAVGNRFAVILGGVLPGRTFTGNLLVNQNVVDGGGGSVFLREASWTQWGTRVI